MSEFIAVVEDFSRETISEANHIIKVEKLVHAVDFVTGIVAASISEGSKIEKISAKIIDLDTCKVVVQSFQYADAMVFVASADDAPLYADIPHRIMHRGVAAFGVWDK